MGTGGGGRAKGFGGPWAPALNIAPAEGDGGGKTTPEPPFSALVFAGVEDLLPEESRDDSAVALPPPSECSLGICTFNCGRFDGNGPLLVRDGLDSDPERGASVAALTGIDLELEKPCGSGSTLREWVFRGGSYVGAPAPKWRASTDPRSSIGVKMLRDLERDFI